MNFHVATLSISVVRSQVSPLVSVHGWPFYTRVSVSKTKLP